MPPDRPSSGSPSWPSTSWRPLPRCWRAGSSSNILGSAARFYRQCIVSADPDETVIAPIIEAVGAEYFVWASDYPHIDASMGVVGEIRSRLETLSEEDQLKVLGLNAVRFYGLDPPSPA